MKTFLRAFLSAFLLALVLWLFSSILFVQKVEELSGVEILPALPEMAHIAESPPEEEEVLRFFFVGDIMLGRYIHTLYQRRGAPFPFQYFPEDLEAIAQGKPFDFVVGNLEGPITTSRYVNPGTAMIFNFSPDWVPQALKKAGFTHLSLANNHTLDMGADGPRQTVEFLKEQGLHAYGHMDTPDGPYSVHKEVFKNQKLCFLGLNDAVHPLDEAKALEKIRQLDAECDVLIASVHWGPEYLEKAPESVRTMGHRFVEAGVDFIHGHHPHRIQDDEVYQGVPIFYSLGNFVFDQYWASYTQEGLGVSLEWNPETGEFKTEKHYFDLIEQGQPKWRRESLFEEMI